MYADADFAGGWSVADLENTDNVLSRTIFVIFYANCPIVWCSRLQTKIALSTAQAEYIAMSHALRETIPIQNLIKEISCIFHIPNPMTDCCIKLYKDNLLAIAMAESLKFTPQTKHIVIKYHHFCSIVHTSSNKSGDININTSIPRSNLQIFLPSQLIMLASLLFT